MKASKTTVAVIAILLLAGAATIVLALPGNGSQRPEEIIHQIYTIPRPTAPQVDTPKAEKGCVFKTVFGEEPSDSDFVYKTPQNVAKAQTEALAWLAKAQNNDGGWGAGSHSSQGVMDPHAVKSDPASTALVAMSLLRCRNTPTPVSYTHLDVYKRQTLYFAKFLTARQFYFQPFWFRNPRLLYIFSLFYMHSANL